MTVSQQTNGLPSAVAARLARHWTACEAGEVPLGAMFDAVGQATAELLGPGLLTINAWRPEQSAVVRLWSSDPAAYPVGGSKRKGDTPWTRCVLQRAEVFVGEGDAALAEVFDDIATIRGLGLQSVVNVPLREQGRCIGTFNFLSSGPGWQADEVRLLEALAQWATPALLRRESAGEQVRNQGHN